MKLQDILYEYVERRGSHWVVLNHARTKILGTHPTRALAIKQLDAIEINKHAPLKEELITPNITWRVNGDKSHTVRVEYTPEKVFVHTNKQRSVLEKIVKDRYGPATFGM